MTKKKKFLHRKNIVDTMCSNLNRGEKKAYWRMLRKLEGSPDHTNYMHEQQMIDHFQSILNDPSLTKTEDHQTEDSSGALDHPIVKDELEKAKRILKAGKAPGMDNLLNEMIEPLVELYPKLLLKLFNNVLTNTWICNDWLLSLITTIHKKGTKEDPDNYRGVSLMSCLAKLFLTIINDRLTEFVSARNILSSGQLGFVSGNRTSDPHIILNNIVQKYCHKKKKKVYGCFIDFSRAFDSVPRDILLKKLAAIGINGKIYDIIKAIYSHDKASVKFGQKYSPTFRTNRGVRQGSVLSPLLFNIFLSDIQKVFDDCGTNPTLNGEEISALIWADDILIFDETEHGLQAKLNALGIYCKSNKLQVNTDKTKTMTFTKSGRLLNHRFFFQGTQLENVREYKYLGFIVTPSGEIKTGLEDLRVRALRAVTKIRKALGPLFQRNIWNTIHLYNYMVRPILLYAADFWGCLKQPKDNPIEKIQLSFYKQLLGVRKQTNTYAVLLELGSFPLKLRAIKASVKNWERIKQSNCNKLLIAAHTEAKTEKLPWVTTIKDIFESNEMLPTYQSNETETRESHMPHMLLFNKMVGTFHQTALDGIKDSSKLRFYSCLKKVTRAEKYLTSISNVKHRVDLTRLRLSSHSLHIETGRHTATKHEDRTCTLCNTGAIEDEVHTLIQCNMYDDIRSEHLEREQRAILTDHRLTDHEKAVKLLTTDNLNPIAKCIHEIFEKRKVLLESLNTLNVIIDKVCTDEAHSEKIEKEARITLEHIIEKVEKIEKNNQQIFRTYEVSNIDENGLKILLKVQNSYRISNTSDSGLKMVLTKVV